MKTFVNRILICFGELIAERRHRDEKQQSVEVHLTDHIIDGKKCSYFLRWNIDGTLDILTVWDDVTAKMRIATLDMHRIGDFGRSLAMVINIVISTFEEGLEKKSWKTMTTEKSSFDSNSMVRMFFDEEV